MRISAFLSRAVVAIACGLMLSGIAPRPLVDEPGVVFAVAHDGGMRGDSGTVIVGWSDGAVVFAMNPDKPEKDLRTGTITAEQIRAILDELTETGFFKEHRRGSYPPDAAHTWMTAVRDGKKVSYVSTEWLGPPYNANVESEPEVKASAKMWAVSRTVLAFAYPKEFTPLKDKPEIAARYKKSVAKSEFPR